MTWKIKTLISMIWIPLPGPKMFIYSCTALIIDDKMQLDSCYECTRLMIYTYPNEDLLRRPGMGGISFDSVQIEESQHLVSVT